MPNNDDPGDELDPRLQPALAVLDLIAEVQAAGGIDNAPLARALIARGAALMLSSRGPADAIQYLRHAAQHVEKKGN